MHVLDERGQLKPVPVETGLTDNTLTEIISGDLKPGDRVVTRETGGKRDSGAGGGNFRFRM